MPTKVITYKDATVTVHAAVFGETTVDVSCRNYAETKMSLDDFAELIYPAIDAKARQSSDDDP
jgi:hypothetical protein